MFRLPQGKFATAARRRSGRVLLWLLSGVLIVFVSFLAYRTYFGQRDRADPLRLQELKNAPLAAAGTAAAGDHDWPQWRGPNRDGVSLETAVLLDWPKNGPKVLWEQPSGEGYSAPAISQGRAFLIVHDAGADQDEVVCWQAETGAELWRFRYTAATEPEYGGPRATPTVDGDLLYTVGGGGMMHCLKVHPKTSKGEVVWKHDMLGEFSASNLRWGVSFSPLVVGELVYTMPGGANGNSLAAFDKRSGKLVWKNLDDTAGYSSPIHATLAGTEQVVFFTASGLAGVAPHDGKLLWRFPWDTNYGCNIATPIVVNDYVFISSGYGKGCGVVKIEKQEGTLTANLVYSNVRMRNHFSSSVFCQDHVYGFNDGILTCLDFRTGANRWSQRGFEKGSLMIAAGHLIILGENGTLALAEATPAAYKEKFSAQIGDGRCWTMPVLANGLLYIRDEHKVRCLDLRPVGHVVNVPAQRAR